MDDKGIAVILLVAGIGLFPFGVRLIKNTRKWRHTRGKPPCFLKCSISCRWIPSYQRGCCSSHCFSFWEASSRAPLRTLTEGDLDGD
ncbi:hypothetical protein BJQ97_00658 [Geobacillus sp. TFV-3]|nr:hypothetical protein BJQ97_00658 [Geobacillus sp. TFV-3]